MMNGSEKTGRPLSQSELVQLSGGGLGLTMAMLFNSGRSATPLDFAKVREEFEGLPEKEPASVE